MAILGIDEVGRGPLAGPLVVGAVILPEDKPAWISELKDSKKLTPKKREKYSEIILREALATGLGWVKAAEIDKVGIANALKLAVRRAVEEAQRRKVAFSEIIIDGKINFLAGTRLESFVTTLVKADDLIKEVSAASIIAKVARDRYMVELASKYPGYAFEKNMGYGTAAHLKALATIGPCPEHRKSFEPLKSQLGYTMEKPASNTTTIGRRGEDAVAEYLERAGHQIVARNFKTKTCEIDLVSILKSQIYFTEVKYRKTHQAGSGFEAITEQKLRQMEYAAQVFLKMHPKFKDFSPILAAAAVSGEAYEIEDWRKIL